MSVTISMVTDINRARGSVDQNGHAWDAERVVTMRLRRRPVEEE